MNKFFIGFLKLTAWPVQFLCFRTKIYYKDKKVQSRKIKKDAIIMSNHTSVYDYAAFLFVFFGRILRYQMAEVLFEKKGLGKMLKWLGGIKVDRNTTDFSFLAESNDILSKGGVVGVFPESRIPRPEEERPLEFKTSATYLALESNSPIIPVWTNGSYFKKKRARVIIGTPIYAKELWNDKLGEKENIENITAIIRKEIIELGKQLDEKTKK